MINFFGNVLKGLGGLLGILIIFLIVTFLGGAIWLILSTIGLITIGMFRFLLWLIMGGAMTILLLWFIGYLLSGKDAH